MNRAMLYVCVVAKVAYTFDVQAMYDKKRPQTVCVCTPLAHVLSQGSSIPRTIYEAAQAGDVKTVYNLVSANRQLLTAQCPQTGNTALHIAALWGHVELVKFLLDNAADVHMRNLNEQTAVHCAAAQLKHANIFGMEHKRASVDPRNDIVLRKVTVLRILLECNNAQNVLDSDQVEQLYGKNGEKLKKSAKWSPRIKRVIEEKLTNVSHKKKGSRLSRAFGLSL